MKKHNSIKVILIAIIVLAILTWIIPAAYFQTELVEEGRLRMGLFDLFNYPVTALSYFGYIALFILVVGGFYGILYRIPAYRKLLDKIVDNLKGNEKLFLVVTVIVFAVLTSLCGVQLALLIFFPFVAAIILLLGYDKIVVALTLVGSTMIGMMGTTTAYSNISVLLSYLSTGDVDINTHIGTRIAILLIGVVGVIMTTLSYIKKHAIVGSKNIAAKKTVRTVEEKIVGEKTTEVEEKEEKTKKNTSKSTKSSSTKKSGSKGKSTSKKGSKSGSKKRNDNKNDLVEKDVIVIKENGTDEFVPIRVDGTHKVWPIVLSIFVMFVVLVLAFIPWESAFGSTAFTTATEKVTSLEITAWSGLLIGLLIVIACSFLGKNKRKSLIIGICTYVVLTTIAFLSVYGFHIGKTGTFLNDKINIFGVLFGTINAFGSWTINDLIPLLVVVTLFLCLVYKVKFDDVVGGFVEGCKKAFVPALVTVLIYTVLVLVTYHPFQAMIYKFVLGWTTKFNVFTTSIVAILASTLNADPLYSAQSVLPYFTSVFTDVTNYSKVFVLFQSMYGLTMLVAPTSLILMIVLSYLRIPFGEWFKSVWKLVLALLILVLFILIIWSDVFSYIIAALAVILLIVLAITKKL